jgi:hypothetical protein
MAIVFSNVLISIQILLKKKVEFVLALDFSMMSKTRIINVRNDRVHLLNIALTCLNIDKIFLNSIKSIK